MAGGPDTVGNLKPRFGGVFLVAGFGFAGAGEHAGYGLRISRQCAPAGPQRRRIRRDDLTPP